MWKFWVSREERREMDRKRKIAEAEALMLRVDAAISSAIEYGSGGEKYRVWNEDMRPSLRSLLKEHADPQRFHETLFGRYWVD